MERYDRLRPEARWRLEEVLIWNDLVATLLLFSRQDVHSLVLLIETFIVRTGRAIHHCFLRVRNVRRKFDSDIFLFFSQVSLRCEADTHPDASLKI